MPLNRQNLKASGAIRYSPWLFAMIGGVALYLFLSLVYLLLGQPNADEGWYLYASKLVMEGDTPYQDFAYTQMPLLPYIYGIPQAILSPSIYLGRVTSILFSFSSLILCVLISRKYAGEMAGGVVAMLLATFTYGIYFNTIVKTYALTSLFFMLTFFFLSSGIRDEVKFPLAAIFAICAAMVRLSALFFAIPIIVYSLAVRPWKVIRFVLCPLLCIAVGASFFLMPNMQAVKWNLVTHHVAQWGDISATDEINQILFLRIPSIARVLTPYLFVTFVAAFAAYRNVEVRSYLRRNSPILGFSTALAFFAVSHFGTGGWHIEYFVPAVISLFPIIAIVISKAYDDQETNSSVRLLIKAALIATFLASPLGYGVQHIDISGGRLPLDEIQDISTFVSQHSEASDKILVLEALWVAVDADRSVLPGLTMAQFSYQEMSTEDAKELNVVNYDMILEYINNGEAKVIVFTYLDWQMFERTGSVELLHRALDNQYELVLVVRDFGQCAGEAYIYLPRDDRDQVSLEHLPWLGDTFLRKKQLDEIGVELAPSILSQEQEL